jgi:hypothetical protein
MNSDVKELRTIIPDLRKIPLAELAKLGGSPLAQSIILYRERLQDQRVPRNSFQAGT